MKRRPVFALAVINLVLICGIFTNIHHYNRQLNDSQIQLEPLTRILSSANPIMEEFFVSPAGDDANSGEDAEHPFGNLTKAQDAVRALTGSMTGDIIVNLMPGTYRIDETLRFNQSDGGNSGYNVIYKNYATGDSNIPIISGGVNVTEWTAHENGIWKASIPSEVDDFRQLYVNGKTAIRARGKPDFITTMDGDGHEYSDPEIETWGNIQDVEFVYNDIWTLPRVRVDKIYKEKIYMQQPAYMWSRTKSDSGSKNLDWIENAYELLDTPGEWYLDKQTRILYYIPLPGEQMANAEVVAPRTEVLVNITGNSTHKVSNLKFQGIKFQHSTWLRPNEYAVCYVAVQANVIRTWGEYVADAKMSDGSIYSSYATNLHFYKCNFTKMGTTAVDIREGVQNSSVIGCKIYNNSGSGIQIGEVSNPTHYNPDDPQTVKNIKIHNNYIANCCTDYRSGCGVFTGYVRNVSIEHNNICNLPYTGVSVGWGWSPIETIMRNNSVKYNHIYGIMNYLRDGGGIYTLSTQPGLNVSYNLIHDSGWNGLYPDERTNGSVWSYNVVYDTYDDILDHSRYEEGHWNDVFHNYLEDYPKSLGNWYPERDGDQIWGLRPDDVGFPTEIVEMAGLEDAYQYLIPKNEQYWHFNAVGALNPLGQFPILLWISIGVIFTLATYGIYWMIKPEGKNRKLEIQNGGVHN